MRLNTKCSIALHCLVFISEYENKTKVTSELLAKSTGCNSSAIRSILNALQKAGMISITRGVGGAYLVRKPEDLTVWEVYHALEPDGLEHFVGLHPHPSEKCPVGSRIETVLKIPYQRIGAAVQAAMEEITLRQLLNDYHGNPFFSETNMAYVNKSVQEPKVGKGTAHGLIEVDDE